MKTIGIIGGMGPMATADLYQKMVSAAKAERDSDHPHTIIDSDTQIPDRTAALVGKGESPVPRLVASALRLEAAGADFLIIACNTAHCFIDKVKKEVSLPFVSMPEETALFAGRRGYKTVGLLATSGTVNAGIYQSAFKKQGVTMLLPSKDGQEQVMRLIYDGVKAGKKIEITPFLAELEEMRVKGAEAFVLACTELPVAFSQYGISYPAVDPTDILAKAALRRAGCEVVE